MKRPAFVAIGLAVALVLPVFEAGRLLGWSPTVAGWWSLVIIGFTSVLWSKLAEREEEARKRRGRRR